MSFRIESIGFVNIGPFGKLQLKFPEKLDTEKAEIHILTGENGTGKTTVLEMMAACLKLQVPSEFLDKCRNAAEVKGVQLGFYYGSQQGRTLKPDSKAHESVHIRQFWERFEKPTSAFPFAFFAYSGYRRVSNVEIKGIQELQEHALKGALDFQRTSNPQLILQWIANTKAAEAIATSQQEPEEAEQRRMAIQKLEESITDIIGKKVSFKLETKPYAVKVDVDGERLSFNLLPDGLKSIISWIADLLMRMDRVKWLNEIPVFERNFVLFLDEIEVHLHPAWQRKILPAVQKLFPNAQIFISTHSPFVVGSVDGAWIHKLVKPNGDSQLAEGYPMLSEDAKSFRYWLDEVFDISSEYGVEADRQLTAFYELRDTLLKKPSAKDQQLFIQAGQALAIQSEELRQIIEMELRQVNRRLDLRLSI
ncbi:MAG: AAA family ATPase [Saprospiraceae bacterium]